MRAQKIYFDGSQGKLAAALEMPETPPRAFALFAHCFSCSKDIKAAREMAGALKAAGIAVLRFDFTGLGASEGDFANTNFSSNVDDLLNAANFLRDNFEAPQILIGHSLGGAAAIVAATRISEVKAVAVVGAPAEAAHVLHQFGDKHDDIENDGSAEVLLAGRPFTIKKHFVEDLKNQTVLKCAEKLNRPLLVLHAPFDQTVGVENAQRIFMAAKHPKSFVSLDTADHLLSRTEDAQYASSVVAAWAGRYIDSNGADRASGKEMAPIKNGAAAQTIDGKHLAVSMSIDGYPYVIDASTEDGGDDLGPNPTRVVEAALAACSVMTMRLYADRKGWDLDQAKVTVKRAPGQDSHAARVLKKEIEVSGALDEKQTHRLIEIAGKCPVHRMLSEKVAIESPNT